MVCNRPYHSQINATASVNSVHFLLYNQPTLTGSVNSLYTIKEQRKTGKPEKGKALASQMRLCQVLLLTEMLICVLLLLIYAKFVFVFWAFTFTVLSISGSFSSFMFLLQRPSQMTLSKVLPPSNSLFHSSVHHPGYFPITIRSLLLYCLLSLKCELKCKGEPSLFCSPLYPSIYKYLLNQ